MAVNLPSFEFHDCRHYFISMCVTSGINYMTIARWVGHSDGGVLIHVIPRRTGDVADPRGGMRWILPEKAKYW